MGTKEKKQAKQIIFCQGNKKELEEITGEEYEYLKLKDKEDRNYKSTFVTLHTYNLHGQHPEITLKYDMYRIAKKAGANAVIHYSTQIIKHKTTDYHPDCKGIARYPECEGIAQGTFLKKRRG